MQNQSKISRCPSIVCLSQNGFSLIEILVVIGIMAAMITTAIGAFGVTASSKLRTESRRMITLIQYVYNEASLNNSYYRIVFNLDEQTYSVENSAKPFYIIKEDDKAEEIRKKNEERNTMDDKKPDANEPVFAETENDSVEVYSVAKGIKIADVFAFHQKEKQTEGKAYLYFFPRGLTEFTVIHLSDEDGEEFRTLIVNPLTAQVEMLGEYKEQEDILAQFEED